MAYRLSAWVAVLWLMLRLIGYAISFFWPALSWDLRLPSPTGDDNLVVLRAEVSAFSDYTFEIYVFPKTHTPKDFARDAFVFNTSVWRGDKYLVYSSDNYPTFRWISRNKIEIDIHQLNYNPVTLLPIKNFGNDGTVFVSLEFENDNNLNVVP